MRLVVQHSINKLAQSSFYVLVFIRSRSLQGHRHYSQCVCLAACHKKLSCRSETARRRPVLFRNVFARKIIQLSFHSYIIFMLVLLSFLLH